MGQGVNQIFFATMASGGTLSAAFKLQRAFENVFLVVPSFTSNTELYIKASQIETGTYRRITHPAINANPTTINDFTILSSVTSRMVPIPSGFKFLKVETSATIDSGQLFTIICGD